MASVATAARSVNHAMQTPDTALVPAGVRHVITSQRDFAALLQQWQAEAVHALCPTIDFGALPEQFALVPAKVKIDPDPTMGDVYFRSDFCKPGEVALTAIGLQKIANCAGISLITRRTDPRTLLQYWEFQAVASWTGLDGAKQIRTATKEWDLRDGAEQIKGFTPKQISEARKHGARNAETRAINAVIRQLGVKQKYTVQELQKPFGVVRVVFQPDMKDPVQRAVVAHHAMGGTATMYPTAALAAAPGDVIEGQLADTPSSHESRPAPAPSDVEFDVAPGATATPVQPAPPTRYTITAVQKRDRAGQSPVFYVLTEETKDQRLHTEDEQLARTALRAKGAGAIVSLELETRGLSKEAWILELTVADAETAAAAKPIERYVVTVDEKKGTNARGEWILFTLTFSTGEQGTTFSKSIGEAAKKARDTRAAVTPRFENNPQYPDTPTVSELLLGTQASFLESEL